MITAYYNQHRHAFKWIGIALLIKLVLFILFAVNFLQNWPAHFIINHFFIGSGDTAGYYEPVEAFAKGLGYTSYCRMPGLLPIYGPLYFLFGEAWGKTGVILVQFLFSATSVYFLARAAELIFKSRRIFLITFFLYAGSSFVSIWDHYGLSDSFSTSFLVLGFYFFAAYLNSARSRDLILSGFWITWSIFFRPINGIIFPCLLLIFLIQYRSQLLQFIKGACLFLLPCILAIALWTTHNYVFHKKLIMLQGSFSDCYGQVLPEEHLAIRELVIAWGGDYQEWSKGTEADWFFSKKGNYRAKNPFTETIFTSRYTLDSLLWLKVNYDSLRGPVRLPEAKRDSIKTQMIAAAGRYTTAYRTERPFRFYVLNRLKFLQRFTFPARLNDLPFPELSKMALYQKVLKLGYLLLLNLVSLTGLIGTVMMFRRRNIYGIIPISMIVIVAGVLGFVEQRYLVPAYPFLCIFSAVFVSWLWSRFRRNKNNLAAR